MGTIRSIGLSILTAWVFSTSGTSWSRESEPQEAADSLSGANGSDESVTRVQTPPPATPSPRPSTPSPTPRPPAAPARPQPPAATPPAPPSSTPPGTTIPTSPPTGLANATAPNLAGAQGPADLAGFGFNYTPVMLGDQAPFSLRQVVATPVLLPPPAPNPARPPIPPEPTPGRSRGAAMIPWVRGFKIADNQSPRPQDRFFFTFNYFNDLNGPINRRLGASVGNQQVYRELFGLEKTFLGGNASIGVRLPVNTLTADSPFREFGGTTTAVGNLTVFSKYVLWSDPKSGNLISTGLAVTAPNGPTSFAGARNAVGFHDAQIQPFLGYIWTRDRWYLQGFEAIDVPTDSHDVTMLYNDVGLGYYLYRNPDPDACLTAIAPTFEAHVNVPLNHQGAFRFNDIAGTPSVVDLTIGTSFLFGRRGILSFGFVNPVTGPRAFNYEWSAMFSVYFGRTRAAQPLPTPPVFGM